MFPLMSHEVGCLIKTGIVDRTKTMLSALVMGRRETARLSLKQNAYASQKGNVAKIAGKEAMVHMDSSGALKSASWMSKSNSAS